MPPQSPSTAAPRLSRATFAPPATSACAPVASIEAEGAHDGVEFAAVPAGRGTIDAALGSFLDCTFTAVDAAQATLDAAHVRHCLWSACGLAHLSAVRADITDTRFDGVRIGAFDAMDSRLASLAFTHCRIGYLNLRAASARDVTFADCIVDELDAADARLVRVAFPGTRIGTLTLQHAELADVDLRDARLTAISGVQWLRGATMTLAQVGDLAPAFAASLGIRTE